MAFLEPTSSFQDLLPGLSDDITLAQIAPKLPWPLSYAVASVSKRWQQTRQGSEVYRERLRTNSTETLVAIKHLAANRMYRHHAMSIFSSRQRKFYQLPPLPVLPVTSQFSDIFSLDGKLFVVVADRRCQCYACAMKWPGQYDACIGNPSIPAYQLDLTGQRKWIACTHLQEPRRDGNRRGFKAPDGTDFGWFSVEPELGMVIHEMIYPSSVDTLGETPGFVVMPTFRAQGNQYRMTLGPHHQIEVYDTDNDAWTLQHSIASDGFARQILPPCQQVDTPLTVDYLVIVPVDNELLALAHWSYDRKLRNRNRKTAGYCLLESIGFGTDSPEIVWKKISHPFQINPRDSFAMCFIEL